MTREQIDRLWTIYDELVEKFDYFEVTDLRDLIEELEEDW